MSNESLPPDATGLYDPLPDWALDAVANGLPQATVAERLATGLLEVLGATYPTAGFVVSAGSGHVTTLWRGGPTALDVLQAVELEWAFEDRGAWIATVDFANPTAWPEGEVVSFVFRRRDT